MTVRLSDCTRIGDITIAVLVRQSVHYGLLPVSFFGTKRPLAILLRHPRETSVFRPDGTAYDMGAFESEHPGQRAAFEDLVEKQAG